MNLRWWHGEAQHLEAYALGLLSPQERENLERHLPECAACRQDLEELRSTRERLDRSAVALQFSSPRLEAWLADLPNLSGEVDAHPRRLPWWWPTREDQREFFFPVGALGVVVLSIWVWALWTPYRPAPFSLEVDSGNAYLRVERLAQIPRGEPSGPAGPRAVIPMESLVTAERGPVTFLLPRIRLALNVGGRLRWNRGGVEAREVYLVEGSVAVKVTPGTPFGVRTELGHVRSKGTEFIVNMTEEGQHMKKLMMVAVLAGIVEVGNESGTILLAAGEEATVREDEAPEKTLPVPAPANPADWEIIWLKQRPPMVHRIAQALNPAPSFTRSPCSLKAGYDMEYLYVSVRVDTPNIHSSGSAHQDPKILSGDHLQLALNSPSGGTSITLAINREGFVLLPLASASSMEPIRRATPSDPAGKHDACLAIPWKTMGVTPGLPLRMWARWKSHDVTAPLESPQWELVRWGQSTADPTFHQGEEWVNGRLHENGRPFSGTKSVLSGPHQELRHEMEYVDGVTVKSTTFHADGHKVKESEYQKGVGSRRTEWLPDGTKWMESQSYEIDPVRGRATFWTPKGQRLEYRGPNPSYAISTNESVTSEGKPFTGILVTSRRADGAVSGEIELSDGRRVRETTYYWNGKKISERIFGEAASGELTVAPFTQTTWDPRGRKIKEIRSVTEGGGSSKGGRGVGMKGTPPLSTSRSNPTTYWDDAGTEIKQDGGGVWRSGGAHHTGTVVTGYNMTSGTKYTEIDFHNGRIIKNRTFEVNGRMISEDEGAYHKPKFTPKLEKDGQQTMTLRTTPPGYTWFGAEVESLDRSTLISQGLFYGVAIKVIAEKGPAALAELQVGDVLLTCDGQPIVNPSELNQLIESYASGSRVKIEILRNHLPLTLWVTLDRKPE